MPALPPDALPSHAQGGAAIGVDSVVTSVFGYGLEGEPLVHVDYGNHTGQLQDYTPVEFLAFLNAGYRAILHSLAEVHGPLDVFDQLREWADAAEDVTRASIGHLLDISDEPRAGDYVPAI